jgi:hypothetical protein
VSEHEDERGFPTGSDAIAELEAFIAQTEARGEPIPPEARAMLARLKELMAAIEELRTSFEKGEEP